MSDVVFLSSCVPRSSSLMRPLGAYQVAWYLRKHNYSVQVIDFIFRMSEDEIMNLLNKFITKDTKALGLGLMIHMEAASMGVVIKKVESVLHQCKKLYPWIKIVTGGPASPTWSRLHRNKTLFDYIFTGHGEDTMLALCNHLFRDAPHPQFEVIDGNRFIKETFKMPHDNLFHISEDDHLWHDSDCIQPHEALPLELGRGCIFKCKFCRYPYIGKAKNDFSRNMECIKNELVDNYTRWGVTTYYMLDDTFNADQDRMKEFWQMTQTLSFKLNFATYLRADLLNAHPDTQYMLLESGLKGAYLGIESFHPKASALIGKNWSPKAKEYLPRLDRDIWKRKVNFQVGLICGLPPESFDECLETNQWLIDNEMPSWAWHALNINRDAHDEFKSDFDTNAEQYGFRWTTLDGKPMWQTEFCNRKMAQEWEVHFTEISKPHQRLTGWHLMETASYGYNLDDMLFTKQVNWPWRDVNRKRKEFLTNYMRDIKSLTA